MKAEMERTLPSVEVDNLSEEETKKFLTPFAFKIDKSLFGLPLASPSKRGIALLIDFILIALLSEMSGVFLAFAIAVTLYYLGNSKRAQQQGKTKGRKRRAVMRFISALILFLVLANTLPTLLNYFSHGERLPKSETADKVNNFAKSIALTATSFSAMQTFNDSDCLVFSCWQEEVNKLANSIAEISFEGEFDLSEQELQDFFNETSQEIKLKPQERDKLITSMHNSFSTHLNKLKAKANKQDDSLEGILVEDKSKNTQTEYSTNEKNKEITLLVDDDGKLIRENSLNTPQTKKPVYSLIEWVKGIIHDLGLGFGWAMFYFTVLTSIWHGQTIGKKLLGIRVIQLDGTNLSLWDSFGRYGGYGAGLATGLLGFIQIYWNPNKQAIHDQISATVVIDLNKAPLSNNKL